MIGRLDDVDYELTFTSTPPLSSVLKPPCMSKIILVELLIWIFPSSEVDCILEAVLIVSPNKQYRGILDPTTPLKKEEIYFRIGSHLLSTHNHIHNQVILTSYNRTCMNATFYFNSFWSNIWSYNHARSCLQIEGHSTNFTCMSVKIYCISIIILTLDIYVLTCHHSFLVVQMPQGKNLKYFQLYTHHVDPCDHP